LGSFVQVYAAFRFEQPVSCQALASILVSALSTGFITASISLKQKSGTAERELVSYFSPKRYATAFLCIVVNAGLMQMLRATSLAFMAVSNNGAIGAYYLIGDMALFLLLKLARSDFHCGEPVEGRLSSIFVSLVLRVVTKLLADNTGGVHLRHAQFMGGLHWSVNSIMALASCLAASLVFSFNYREIEGNRQVTEPAVFLTLGGIGLWIATFFAFLVLMKQVFSEAFWSTQSGSQQTMLIFLEGAGDAAKAEIIHRNKWQWEGIREAVRVWVHANYLEWEETTPAPTFFDSRFKARLEEDMIPNEFLLTRKFLEAKMALEKYENRISKEKKKAAKKVTKEDRFLNEVRASVAMSKDDRWLYGSGGGGGGGGGSSSDDGFGDGDAYGDGERKRTNSSKTKLSSKEKRSEKRRQMKKLLAMKRDREGEHSSSREEDLEEGEELEQENRAREASEGHPSPSGLFGLAPVSAKTRLSKIGISG